MGENTSGGTPARLRLVQIAQRPRSTRWSQRMKISNTLRKDVVHPPVLIFAFFFFISLARTRLLCFLYYFFVCIFFSALPRLCLRRRLCPVRLLSSCVPWSARRVRPLIRKKLTTFLPSLLFHYAFISLLNSVKYTFRKMRCDVK